MDTGRSTAEWELSKENIQPLKQGRQFSKLNNILQPNHEEMQKKIHEERQAFETELRTYSGADPMDPWYRYISWIEQSYPKGGKEGNIHVILEKCIQKFKDDKSVHSDSRYLEVWLKYAAISAKPLDIYDFMYKQGICTQQAGLYEAWAWQLERAGSYKKAEVVFVKGIGAMTDPQAKEGLAARQKQFQARVVRRLKGEEIPEEETEEEQRAALGKLRGHGKHAKVGSIRVGNAKMGGPGVLQVNKQPLKENNRQGGFAIFQDENAPIGAAAAMGGAVNLPSSRDRKENEMAAGKWGKARLGRGNVPLDKISQNSKPAFTVHQDAAIVQPMRTPQKVEPGASNVLSARKDVRDEGIVHCPLALFEPPDPSKRPMYCKDKVYQGATEFSFEELQAVKWKAKEAARQESREIEMRKVELQEMEAKLREQQEQVAKQMAEFQKMLAGGSVVAQHGFQGVLVTRPSDSDDTGPTTFIVYSDEGRDSSSGVGRSNDSSSNPSSGVGRSNDSSSLHSLSRKNSAGNSLDDTAALMAANPLGSRSRSFGRSTKTPSPHGNKAPVMSGPSPTVNTKEAMAMMQQLWSKPVGEPSFATPSGFTPTDQQQQQQFEIFSDVTENGAVPICSDRPTPSPIFADQAAEKPANFPIFCDQADMENVKVPNKCKKSRAALFNKIDNKENALLPSPLEENFENIPPPDYSQPPTHLRSKTGILSQAENVDWMPLEVQEKLLDEDERRQEEEFARASVPTFANPNITMALPNQGEFEKMAQMASTPFTGRPFLPDDDENTCAVQLVYRDHTNEDNNDDDESAMGPPEPPQSNPNSLSPIVETSREYYKSSSSSSGPSDASMHGLTRGERSHWGNTGSSTHYKTTDQSRTPGQCLGKTTDNNRTPGESLASLARTPGQFLGCSSVSGYMGDKSSMSNCTKSNRKMLGESRGVTRDFSASPAVNEDKKPRMALLESPPKMADPDFEEDTGMFSDMMAEYRQNLAPAKQARQEEQLERSLQASFVDAGVREEADGFNMTEGGMLAKSLNITVGPLPVPTIHMTGAPPLNMTGAQGLNMTGAPGLNMTGAPGLNMTGAPFLNMTGARAPLNTTGALSLNMTGAPGLNITEAFSLSSHNHLVDQTGNMSLEDDFDPFSPTIHQRLLSKVSVPASQRHGYQRILGKLPQIRARSVQKLGEDTFYVSDCKGEGGFAKVWAATRQDTDHDSTIAGIDAVLKVQKPANEWEWYICTEVQQRLHNGPYANLENGFMSIPRCYSFDDGGIFVSYHQKLGTLLDITNLTKKCGVQKSCIEPMAMYFTIEMLGLIDALHHINIIHADVKADNFLLQAIPSINKNATSAQQMFMDMQHALQMIDFGRAIDLSILPNNISFSSLVKTEGLRCVEMRENKPWRHHIDYFGLAATTYCLLFGNYMEIVKVGGLWEVKGSYKRWWQVPLWKEFFAEFLNIGGLEKEYLPNLVEWRKKFCQVFFEKKMGNHLDTLRSDVAKFIAGY